MAQDPEKRFHSIMDKLFGSPKSVSTPSSSSGLESSRGKKRPSPESSLALVEPKTRGDVVRLSQRSLAPAQSPLCRPWDRGDFMRRLATFKSMTWFAKPKVVSAVNCARRGWINLDMDIIGCEACGARLLFSTSSSWMQQQVEKAALVFSLKLDNGHKLLCPWIDNACDERLAEFPPTPHPLLVDKFRERSSALMQLLALPVISSATLEHMRSAQLEEFLRQSPIIDYGNGSITVSQVESLQNESDADSAKLYYQAQKLISLCGWEPRSLPYVVECKDALNPSHIVNGQNTSISFYSSNANETREASEDFHDLCRLHADPHSIVLDCKLCGANVGLWTFSTVPQPVELFRLVGYAEMNNKKNWGQDSSNGNKVDERGAIVNSSSNDILSSIDRPSNLNLTIAGGPPPTKQNFKATISLPVIGRNLRARFSYDTEFRDRIFNDQELQSRTQNKNLILEENGSSEEQVSQLEALGKLKSKTVDQGQCSYATGEKSYLNLESDGKGSAFGNKCDILTLLEGTDVSGEENFLEIGVLDSITENPIESISDVTQVLDQSNKAAENSKNVGSLDSPAGNFGSSQVRMSCISDSGTNVTSRNENSMYNSNIQNMSSSQEKGQKTIKNRVQNPVNGEIIANGTVKELRKISDKAMEFDPIRQHRHFCPWIVSTNSGASGWQQTLSAFLREKEHSSPSTKSPPTTSMLKVDDPIASVRKLFRSPSAKRTKLTHGLS